MSLLLLAILLLACLVTIPLGFPGIWLMLAVGLGFNQLAGSGRIGWTTLIGALVLAIVAELIEFAVSAKFTTRFGGSRRAGWGAILGGFIGALVGVPIPIVGSVIGGFVGAFVGAFAAEASRREPGTSLTRVATGAMLGRVVGAALKSGFGFAIASWLLLAAWA